MTFIAGLVVGAFVTLFLKDLWDDRSVIRQRRYIEQRKRDVEQIELDVRYKEGLIKTGRI